MKRFLVIFALLALTFLTSLILPKDAKALVTPPFNANSIWNKPVPTNAALVSNSNQMINLLVGTINGAINIDGISGAWSVPVYQADATTPHQTVCDAQNNTPCESVPIPAGLIPSPDGDAKTVIIDSSTNPPHAWSFWQFTKVANGWTASRGAFGWGIYDSTGDGIHNYGGGHSGGRVATWNYIAGLITPAEIIQGHIDHALEVNIPVQIAAKVPVWPAKYSDGQSTDTNAIPVGSHIRLDPNINVDSLNLSAGGKMIAKALQTYGGWIGDTGVMATVEAEEFINPNLTINSTPWQNLLTNITLYHNFPISSLEILQTNQADYFLDSSSVQQTPTLTFSFKMQGITHPGITKAVVVTVSNPDGSQTYPLNLTSTTSGIFNVNKLNITNLNITSSPYNIFVSSQTYLRKKIGSINLTNTDILAPASWIGKTLLVGDFATDNTINILDIGKILSQYTALNIPINQNNQIYDINGDGIIDIQDISIVLSNYTQLEIQGD